MDVITREGHLAPKISLAQMVYGDAWGKEADLDEMYIDDGLREALYAASYAPTFLNRQSFRLLLAVMLNFAAVPDERRPFPTEWAIGSLNGYELPADCEIVGYCSL